MDRRNAIKRTGFLLGGTAFSAAIFSNITSCQSAATATEALSWTPSFLSTDQAKTVEIITDILISRTDTPGALDAGVPAYIDLMLKDNFKKEDQDKVMAGFADFASKCQAANGKSFIDSTPEQKLSFLQQLEKEAQDSDEPSFIGVMKHLTYRGFFTSEVGMTEVLKYDPVPGNYDGCIPLADVGGTWAS